MVWALQQLAWAALWLGASYAWWRRPRDATNSRYIVEDLGKGHLLLGVELVGLNLTMWHADAAALARALLEVAGRASGEGESQTLRRETGGPERRSVLTHAELVAAVDAIARDDGDAFFAGCSPESQRSCARFMAGLLAKSSDSSWRKPPTAPPKAQRCLVCDEPCGGEIVDGLHCHVACWERTRASERWWLRVLRWLVRS